jgi:hypothetical protein
MRSFAAMLVHSNTVPWYLNMAFPSFFSERGAFFLSGRGGSGFRQPNMGWGHSGKSFRTRA